jgi:hypothetical protein
MHSTGATSPVVQFGRTQLVGRLDKALLPRLLQAEAWYI